MGEEKKKEIEMGKIIYRKGTNKMRSEKKTKQKRDGETIKGEGRRARSEEEEVEDDML